jgi:hypothetical protein
MGADKSPGGALALLQDVRQALVTRMKSGGSLLHYRFLLILPFLLAQPAFAEPTRDEVMSGAARCAGIADNRGWLDCFYGSAQPMRALLGLQPAPAGQVRLVPPPGAAYLGADAARHAPAPKPRGFLADIVGSTKPMAADIPMASYKFARNGTFTVVLTNGQSYRQVEADLVSAKWTRPPSSYLVTVNSGSDTFALKVKDEPGVIYRVRRISSGTD